MLKLWLTSKWFAFLKMFFFYKNHFFLLIFYSFNPNLHYGKQRRLFFGNLSGLFSNGAYLKLFELIDGQRMLFLTMALFVVTKYWKFDSCLFLILGVFNLDVNIGLFNKYVSEFMDTGFEDFDNICSEYILISFWVLKVCLIVLSHWDRSHKSLILKILPD